MTEQGYPEWLGKVRRMVKVGAVAVPVIMGVEGPDDDENDERQRAASHFIHQSGLQALIAKGEDGRYYWQRRVDEHSPLLDKFMDIWLLNFPEFVREATTREVRKMWLEGLDLIEKQQ